MKEVSAFLVLILVGIAALTVACERAGAKYIGDWQKTDEYFKDVISISKEGDNTYLVVTQRFHRIEYVQGRKVPTQWVPEPEQGKTTHSATLHDGQLKISSGFGDVSIAYIESTQHLLFQGAEYERAK